MLAAVLISTGCTPTGPAGRETDPGASTDAPESTVSGPEHTVSGSSTTISGPDSTVSGSSTTASGPDSTGKGFSGDPADYPDPLTDEQVLQAIAAMDGALQAGDLEGFLAHLDPDNADLNASQAQWFRAVRTVPMPVRELRSQGVISRSSPTGTVVRVVLRHQIEGADPEPVLEEYRWVMAPGDADPDEGGGPGSVHVVDIGGRPAESASGYPQLWDLGEVAALESPQALVLAREDDRARAEHLLDSISVAAGHALDDFRDLQGGRQRVAVQLIDATTMEDIFGLYDDGSPLYSWVMTLPTSEDLTGPEEILPRRTNRSIGTRIMVDIDLAEDLINFHAVDPGGESSVRFGAALAMLLQSFGSNEHRLWRTGWLYTVPTWYEYAQSPSMREDLFLVAADTYAWAGPQSSLPEWDDEEFHALGMSVALYIEEEFGRERLLHLVSRLADVSAFSGTQQEATYQSELGVSTAELVAGWSAWLANLPPSPGPRTEQG